MIEIFNEDCIDTMHRLGNNSIDIILTSPPYNINTPIQTQNMYDTYEDNKTADEYIEWTTDLFKLFDSVMKPNGVILYNLSYSSASPNLPYRVVCDIIAKTDWDIAETIVWKKPWAVAVNACRNRLTRIWEYVFIFCRKSEAKTFISNRDVARVIRSKTYYKNIYNFIEAPNNDGVTEINRATYSTDLCEQLLNIYAPSGAIVYDPFIGTGTTAVACKNLGLDCYGSEISKEQVDYANNRLNNIKTQARLERFKWDLE